jgi:ABC-type dipeptide/oligopeptide/nickel transport system permease subunit
MTTKKRLNPLDSRFARYYIRPVFRITSAKVGTAVLSILVVMIVGGVLLSPYSPYDVSPQLNHPPSLTHMFGTDWLGRDMFSQVVWGSYPSLFVALTAAFGSVILGLAVGVAAGYFPKLRGIMSGAGDVVMVFPALPLLTLLGTVTPATDLFIASIILLVQWPVVARVVRNQVISIKKHPYVDSAVTSGSSEREIIFGIVIPEVAPIAIAYFILNSALAVVLTVSLEFLGVGNPTIASWGSILYWAQQFAFIAGDWWWVVFPGLFISLAATGFALIGFAIEEVVNPRLAT